MYRMFIILYFIILFIRDEIYSKYAIYLLRLNPEDTEVWMSYLLQ